MTKSKTSDPRLKRVRHRPKSGDPSPGAGHHIADDCPACRNGMLFPRLGRDASISTLTCDSCHRTAPAAMAGHTLAQVRERAIFTLLAGKRALPSRTGPCTRCGSRDRQHGSMSASGPFPLLLEYEYCGHCHYVLKATPPITYMPGIHEDAGVRAPRRPGHRT